MSGENSAGSHSRATSSNRGLFSFPSGGRPPATRSDSLPSLGRAAVVARQADAPHRTGSGLERNESASEGRPRVRRKAVPSDASLSMYSVASSSVGSDTGLLKHAAPRGRAHSVEMDFIGSAV